MEVTATKTMTKTHPTQVKALVDLAGESRLALVQSSYQLPYFENYEHCVVVLFGVVFLVITAEDWFDTVADAATNLISTSYCWSFSFC